MCLRQFLELFVQLLYSLALIWDWSCLSGSQQHWLMSSGSSQSSCPFQLKTSLPHPHSVIAEVELNLKKGLQAELNSQISLRDSVLLG